MSPTAPTADGRVDAPGPHAVDEPGPEPGSHADGRVDEPGSLADHWTALATVALLGTDRRPVPPAPYGPVADLVARAAPADDAEAVLVQVAALAAARRGGVRPAPPRPTLDPCPDDGRPECPPAATRRLQELLDVWPELLDEWLDRLVAAGYRLAPVSAVALLTRYRTDADRRPRVEAAAGPIVAWLGELFPGQFAPRRAAGAGAAAVAAGAAGLGLAGGAAAVSIADAFPLPPDLAPLVGAPPATVVATLVHGLTSGRLANRHRPVLVHLLRRLPPPVLEPLAEALSRAGTNPNTLGLTMSLADLARTRAALVAELPAAPSHPVDRSTTA